MFNNFRVGHNPYFNRWFSAISIGVPKTMTMKCHNPYFNRWFSAIVLNNTECSIELLSQSLF